MNSSKKINAALNQDLLPLRVQHLIALGILFLLPVFLVPEVFFGGKKFFAHDSIQWRASAESIIQHREATGEEPLWAPNMFSGMPAFLVSYMRAVPHLDDLISKGLFVVFPAGAFWLLLGGCYVMFLQFGARPFSSATGAVIIAFTTYLPILIGAGHNTKMWAFSYIPWLVASYLLFRKGEKPMLAAAALALTMNLEMRASHPQVTYYFGLFLAIWWLVDTIQQHRAGKLAPWIKASALVMLPGLLLGVAANIQPYWSIAEYSPFSIRGGSAVAGTAGEGLDADYAFAWSQGWFELLTLLVPGIMGGASATGYWGPKSVTSGPHYLGAVAFVLAVTGYWLSQRKEKHVFLIGGLVAVGFSLGSHFLALNQLMFDFFPFFNKFRTPEMWLIVTVFCGGVLAVFGLEAIVDRINDGTATWKTTLIPVASGAAVLLVLWLGARTTMTFQREDEVSQIAEQVAAQNRMDPNDRQLRTQIRQYIQKELIPQREAVAKDDTSRSVFIALGVLLIIGLAVFEKIPAFWSAPLVLALTAFDMIPVARRYMALEQTISKDIDYDDYFNRMKTPAIDWIVTNGKSTEGWPYRVLPLDENPFNNAVPAYFYPTVGGYSGAKMSIYQDVLNERFYTGSGLNMPLLNMLNVKYITLQRPMDIPGFAVAFQTEPSKRGGAAVVLENTSVLPKAWFVDRVFSVNTAREALDQLGTFDPAEAAFVLGTEAPVSVGRKDSNATAQVVTYSPRKITVKTNNAVPGFLVLSEIFYPAGWKAFVDNQEVPVYQTNYVLRGVETPAGEHEVTFAFEPVSHTRSSTISWTVNLVIIALGAAGFFTGRKNSTSEDGKTGA
jgi:hypothetical protein